MSNLLDKEIEKFKKEIKANLMESGRKAWNDAVRYTYKVLEKEAQNMYDTFIEQYYYYETTSYYRHNAGVGTGWGDNLYYGRIGKGASGINMVKTGSVKDFDIYTLYTNFSGEHMEGYRYNTPDEVLEQVIGGIRGVPQKGWSVPWTGSYSCKYFKYKGKMREAFDNFDSDFEKHEARIFRACEDFFLDKYFK